MAVDFQRLTLYYVQDVRGFLYIWAFLLPECMSIYLEITGLPPEELPFYFPDLEKLANKIIFGSDWPAVTNIAGSIDVIRSLPFHDDTKGNIPGIKAPRVLGLAASRD
ncbi:conserved hypothetical protein [delta proteobacterium NaphS2]|nr:conserved hypothetical protein [delta proteobacterium NaphS2]